MNSGLHGVGYVLISYNLVIKVLGSPLKEEDPKTQGSEVSCPRMYPPVSRRADTSLLDKYIIFLQEK